MEKIWLKSYPKGVPSEINLDEFSSLVDLFDKTCERFNEKTAFTNFGVKISFSELRSHSENLSSYFINELKLKKGDRVSIMMPNILQYPMTTFGILKSGLVVDNINPLFTPRELKAQLNDSGSETIVIAENFAANLQKVINETSIKNVIITSLGEFLGLIIAPVIMAMVYFVFLTPISFLVRIFGKDLLNLKKNNEKSYWIKKTPIKSKMKNQF